MIGRTIAHYKILEKLGEGGMGVVYKAEDTKLERTVALKFLATHLIGGKNDIERFKREAKAAAALNHPNIAQIYAIDEHKLAPAEAGDNDQVFIAMEYIDGKELRETIINNQLSIDNVLNYAAQIAAGLQAAHEKGIVHRDIKSANIMVTDDGKVKIMDFGLAKIGVGSQLTGDNSTLGTVAYMSPEQARGETVDQRSDIWSFGVVLFEMLTGELPFKGEYEQAVMYGIMNEAPAPIEKNIPEELMKIVSKALEKEPGNRFQDIKEVIDAFKNLRKNEDGSAAQPSGFNSMLRFRNNPWIILGGGVVLVLLILFVLVPYYQLKKLQQAKDSLPQIANLVKKRDYGGAFRLAKEAEKYLKEDPDFKKLIPGYSDYLTLNSRPEGARVYFKRFAPQPDGSFSEREYAGLTPIKNLQVVRGGYKVYLEKEGFAPAERVFSSAFALEGIKRSTEVSMNLKLLGAEKAVEGMVFVPGGTYHLVGWNAPTLKEVQLNDFYIDKYEVSNQEFKAFINAGGYSKKQYWKYPFYKNGKPLSWNKAVSQFTDRTGLPGPRNWKNQEFSEGKGNYPVTDITWYEAAAYAEFVNKKLPTIFQWEKAVRNGEYHVYDIVMPWGLRSPNENVLQRANFEGKGTRPVDSYEFGISPFGAYNMAGNVKEWCLNETNEGFIATGGSWQDPVYMFANFGAFPSFYSSEAIGFRCVRNMGEAAGQKNNIKINTKERIPVFKPVDKKTFRSFLPFYRYDKKPLNAVITETTETADWIKQKITFSGANEERIIAYLYLPRRAAKPYQCLNWIPHSGVIEGVTRVDEAVEYSLAPHIKAGRAVLAIAPKGSRERPRKPGFERPDKSTVRYLEQVVHYTIEFSRGLDYLATRKDIDQDRVAFIGTSWGSSGPGIIMAAVEKRYRSIIFMAGGISVPSMRELPQANPINFAPYIRAPKLLLNGIYDEAFPLETEARPFFKLLREPKQLSLVESGHVPPLEKRVPIINNWLDKTLGPVKYEQ